MRRTVLLITALLLILSAASFCGITAPEGTRDDTPAEAEDLSDGEEIQMNMKMKLGGTEAAVEWEDNESVDALRELCADGPLTVEMSMYGGFEQVGDIGESLPRDDRQTVTEAGDIVLYSGNQLVVFYGSNSWAYTRLGHITGMTKDELTELLSGGDITVTLEAE